MNTEKTHGGARKGAGRKPAADKKVGVTLYLESSVVESLGGIDGIREYCYAHLKEKAEGIKRRGR